MISEPTIYKIALLGTGLLCFLIAVGHFKIRQEYIGHLEQNCAPQSWLFAALLALLWCIPMQTNCLGLDVAVVDGVNSVSRHIFIWKTCCRVRSAEFSSFMVVISHESFTRHTPAHMAGR